MLSEIGLIGLGVMGKNIGLNISEKGTNIKAYNASTEKLDSIKKEFGTNFSGYTTLKELVENIARPRNILLMIPSGEPTHNIINQLSDLLDEGDVIIDGGNSFYQESINHGNSLAEKKINFVGMGVSGGEEGARNGPAIMVGSNKNLDENLIDLLSSISAKAADACIGFYEGFGSGHFVKMVHNGIEYAEMQLIAESYFLLKKSGYTNLEIADFFDSLKILNQSSYLIEITSEILRKKEGEKFIIDLIKPSANNKGTGRLTVETALDLGIPAPSIFAAYDARVQSNAGDYWKLDEKLFKQDNTVGPQGSEKTEIFNIVSRSLYFGRISSMIQGLTIIWSYNEVNKFSFNFVDIFKNWSGGCIIRSEMLDELIKIDDTSEDFLRSEELHSLLKVNLDAVKNLVRDALSKDIALPVFSSSLNWYLNLSSSDNPSNLIQAQRDFFGSHTVQLLSSDKYIHIDWRKDE